MGAKGLEAGVSFATTAASGDTQPRNPQYNPSYYFSLTFLNRIFWTLFFIIIIFNKSN